MAGCVCVEIEVNANSAPNWVGVGAGVELGKNIIKGGIDAFTEFLK